MFGIYSVIMPKNSFLTKVLFVAALASLAAVAAPARILAQTDDQPRPRWFLPLAAEPLRKSLANANLSTAEFRVLQASGLVMRFTDGVPAYALNPFPSTTNAIRNRASAQNPDISMEVLLALPITQELAALGTDRLDLFLYNVLHRFSSMKGIEYWSASRQRMRIFYEESSVVDQAPPHAVLPDPVHQSILLREQLVIRQKDSSFGDNRYSVEIGSWKEDGDLGILVRMTNLTTMWYGIFAVAEPGGVSTEVVVRRSADHILFYATTALRVPGLPGLRDKARESFFNRIIALYTWFASQTGLAR